MSTFTEIAIEAMNNKNINAKVDNYKLQSMLLNHKNADIKYKRPPLMKGHIKCEILIKHLQELITKGTVTVDQVNDEFAETLKNKAQGNADNKADNEGKTENITTSTIGIENGETEQTDLDRILNHNPYNLQQPSQQILVNSTLPVNASQQATNQANKPYFNNTIQQLASAIPTSNISFSKSYTNQQNNLQQNFANMSLQNDNYYNNFTQNQRDSSQFQNQYIHNYNQNQQIGGNFNNYTDMRLGGINNNNANLPPHQNLVDFNSLAFRKLKYEGLCKDYILKCQNTVDKGKILVSINEQWADEIKRDYNLTINNSLNTEQYTTLHNAVMTKLGVTMNDHQRGIIYSVKWANRKWFLIIKCTSAEIAKNCVAQRGALRGLGSCNWIQSIRPY